MISLTTIYKSLKPSPEAGHAGMADVIFNEAGIESQKVIPASLFIALPDRSIDTAGEIREAFKRGASAALVQEELPSEFPVIDLRNGAQFVQPPAPPFCILVDDSLDALHSIASYWRSQLSVRVIGITGSVGKTTTKDLTSNVLRQRFRVLDNPGKLKQNIEIPLTILRLSPETTHLVLEIGFEGVGSIHKMCQVARPEIGIITNIGTIHADQTGSQDLIAASKNELIQSLPPAPTGIAILNYDDPIVRQAGRIADKPDSPHIFYYGLSPEADLWADDIESYGLEGIRFRLHYHHDSIHIQVPLIGRHSVHTALRAAAVGLISGLTWQDIASGLRWSRSQLRLVTVRSKAGALILDDTYNASPQSMLAALNLLNDLEGRKICVLGDMLGLGPYERKAHLMVGYRAAGVCDHLIAVGNRSKIIVEAALQSGQLSSRIQWVKDVEGAIQALRELLKEGDIVLVKGERSLGMDNIAAALEVRS